MKIIVEKNKWTLKCENFVNFLSTYLSPNYPHSPNSYTTNSSGQYALFTYVMFWLNNTALKQWWKKHCSWISRILNLHLKYFVQNSINQLIRLLRVLFTVMSTENKKVKEHLFVLSKRKSDKENKTNNDDV